jgi:hypothetical protein
MRRVDHRQPIHSRWMPGGDPPGHRSGITAFCEKSCGGMSVPPAVIRRVSREAGVASSGSEETKRCALWFL